MASPYRRRVEQPDGFSFALVSTQAAHTFSKSQILINFHDAKYVVFRVTSETGHLLPSSASILFDKYPPTETLLPDGETGTELSHDIPAFWDALHCI